MPAPYGVGSMGNLTLGVWQKSRISERHFSKNRFKTVFKVFLSEKSVSRSLSGAFHLPLPYGFVRTRLPLMLDHPCPVSFRTFT
jgi:hypothetical protein